MCFSSFCISMRTDTGLRSYAVKRTWVRRMSGSQFVVPVTKRIDSNLRLTGLFVSC